MCNSDAYRSVLHDLFSTIGITGDCRIKSSEAQRVINDHIRQEWQGDRSVQVVKKTRPSRHSIVL